MVIAERLHIWANSHSLVPYNQSQLAQTKLRYSVKVQCLYLEQLGYSPVLNKSHWIIAENYKCQVDRNRVTNYVWKLNPFWQSNIIRSCMRYREILLECRTGFSLFLLNSKLNCFPTVTNIETKCYVNLDVMWIIKNKQQWNKWEQMHIKCISSHSGSMATWCNQRWFEQKRLVQQ